ncbi:MAG: S1-like domain-containing RNA-binding protein [Oleibacter sp.]|nr:S1-like domain-containing RNA-binding protein [Thalassolituus sp.]
MAEIGLFHTLTVIDQLPQGMYLDDLEGGRLLLPKRYVPEGTKPGDDIDVFVYLDSDDRPIATTLKPKVILHQAAKLTVKDVNTTGAFLDWGLPKDLFVPFAEQNQRMEVGNDYVVYVTIDNTGRLMASAKLNRFIKDEARANWPGEPDPFTQGDQVQILIAQRTDLGYKAIIDNLYWGLIHESQIHKAIRVGQKLEGYIRQIREDRRIDLSLEPLGHGRVDPLALRIINKLTDAGGQLGVGDHTPADLIEIQFGASKRAFKMAIGKLYKEKKIVIEDNGIRLATKEDQVHIATKSAKAKHKPSSGHSNNVTSNNVKPTKDSSLSDTSENNQQVNANVWKTAKSSTTQASTEKSSTEKTSSSKTSPRKSGSEKSSSSPGTPTKKKQVYRNPKTKSENTLKLKK